MNEELSPFSSMSRREFDRFISTSITHFHIILSHPPTCKLHHIIFIMKSPCMTAKLSIIIIVLAFIDHSLEPSRENKFYIILRQQTCVFS